MCACYYYYQMKCYGNRFHGRTVSVKHVACFSNGRTLFIARAYSAFRSRPKRGLRLFFVDKNIEYSAIAAKLP